MELTGNKKSFGFTLSEALIAMAIVGVIAALTLPNVVVNYQRNSYLVGLKKAYTDLQQNLTIMQTENYRNNGIYNSTLHMQAGDTVASTAGKFLTEYYKTVKDCQTSTQTCFADKYATVNGSETAFSCSGYSVVTSSGYAICIYPATKTTEKSEDGETDIEVKNPVTVYLDINGTNSPNIGGRDMFTFNIYDDFTIDEVSPDEIKNGTAEANRNTLYSNNCLSSYTGKGCFGKILNDNWKMNY